MPARRGEATVRYHVGRAPRSWSLKISHFPPILCSIFHSTVKSVSSIQIHSFTKFCRHTEWTLGVAGERDGRLLSYFIPTIKSVPSIQLVFIVLPKSDTFHLQSFTFQFLFVYLWPGVPSQSSRVFCSTISNKSSLES